MTGPYNGSDATGTIDEGVLVNKDGNVLTIELFEELSPGVKLVALNNKEAVFEKDESLYLVINFKNQIIERAKWKLDLVYF